MATEVPAAALRDLVLGILARRDASGLDVAAAVAGDPETTGVCIPEGSIYPALRWIERHGLAAAHWVDMGNGVPRRRYYSLTPKGRRVAARQAGIAGRPQLHPTPSSARP